MLEGPEEGATYAELWLTPTEISSALQKAKANYDSMSNALTTVIRANHSQIELVTVADDDSSRPRIFALFKSHKIGSGAQGDVFLAQELFSNNTSAPRVVKCSTNSLFVDDFTNEYENLKKLDRKPALVWFPIDSNDSIYYLFSQLIEGAPLFNMLYTERAQAKYDKAPLSLLMQVQLVRALLQEVMRFHEHNLFHRDLKTENIMVELKDTYDLTVTLIDFGTACPMYKTTKQNNGTEGYLAPEMGVPLESRLPYTLNCEYYSLGIILSEIMTRKNFHEARQFHMDACKRMQSLYPMPYFRIEEAMSDVLKDDLTHSDNPIELMRHNLIGWIRRLSHAQSSLRPTYKELEKMVSDVCSFEKALARKRSLSEDLVQQLKGLTLKNEETRPQEVQELKDYRKLSELSIKFPLPNHDLGASNETNRRSIKNLVPGFSRSRLNEAHQRYSSAPTSPTGTSESPRSPVQSSLSPRASRRNTTHNSPTPNRLKK